MSTGLKKGKRAFLPRMPSGIRQTRYNRLMQAICRIVFLVFLFSPTGLLHAQIAPPTESGRIIISITPDSPLPGSIVRLSAAGGMTDLEHSDITWYADKEAIAEGFGLTEASISVGSLGSEVDVVVIAQSSDGTSATGEAFISPAEVAIVWESDSYTPPFYKGRALPSAGTKIRMQAVARLILPDGSSVPESDIIYTWRRNGSVIQTASGRGRSFAIFPAPALFGKDSFGVETVSADGTRSGKADVTISSVEPVLALYENHPLFGILYSDAFGQMTSVRDPEMTFAAVPYFAQANSADDPQLVYGWRVNGQQIPADYSRPSEITISGGASGGGADISLSLTRARNWYMKADGAWRFLLPAGGGEGTDPFNSGTQSQ